LAEGDCGLDEYEVRSWTGWHRHTVLSLFALAVVAVIRSHVSQTKRRKRGGRLIPLTVPEVRKLLLRLVWDRLPAAEQSSAWSEWRRRHRYRARQCHYHKRGARPPDH
jgi:SRSO17 transposase